MLKWTEPLVIFCKKHPKYRAIKRPKSSCPSCRLLYVLNWQDTKYADERLNLAVRAQTASDIDLVEACTGLKIWNEYQKTEKLPTSALIRKARKWARSPQGKKEMKDVLEKTEKIIAELKEAIRVRPEDLNKPITI